jgi:hypothetical protein
VNWYLTARKNSYSIPARFVGISNQVKKEKKRVRKNTLLMGMAVVAAAFLATAGARGDVVSGTSTASGGFGILATPPSTVDANNVNINELFAFNEQQNVVLANPLTVDVLNGGPGGGTIAAGTVVSSHYVFFDPPGAGGTINGTVKFDHTVIGIITTNDDPKLDGNLFNSDFLGAAGVTYANVVSRGLEPGDTAVRDSIDPTQVDVHLSASDPGDWIRVITIAPLPNSFWGGVVMLGGIAGLRVMRRRQLA